MLRTQIRKAILMREREPLSHEEYLHLKEEVLRSANDFHTLYTSIPKKLFTDIQPRRTFYGPLPNTPYAMYAHVNEVTSYYMGEISVHTELHPLLYENRRQAFLQLEEQSDYLHCPLHQGKHGEEWTLRKVLRRFLWHDAIHAKALYRLGTRLWSPDIVADPFYFHGWK